MSKWADYCITAVRYTENYNKTYIEKLKVTRISNNLHVEEIITKGKVISLINEGFTFCTIILNEKGNYEKGADVEVIELKVKGSYIYYIRTKGNKEKYDNLGELPTF